MALSLTIHLGDSLVIGACAAAGLELRLTALGIAWCELIVTRRGRDERSVRLPLGERIEIDLDVAVALVQVRYTGDVRLAIEAPRLLPIYREHRHGAWQGSVHMQRNR